ncbi:putative T7SS-secreted protein [Pseudonocardia lacus]|uniref:putative T7SS-secreted protein n=1 Tax=Pseudonocardia lacus TaxID=2835865 RepID=UPI001BDD6A2B|nr:hypothetical protein [Pseudonocardia lacus]
MAIAVPSQNRPDQLPAPSSMRSSPTYGADTGADAGSDVGTRDNDQHEGAASQAELGSTRDPARLVPGNPVRLHAAADELAQRCRDHEATTTQLRDAVPSTSVWDSVAADGFRVYTKQQTNRYHDSALATRTVGIALRRYADALTRAQAEARDAIELFGAPPTPVPGAPADRPPGAASTDGYEEVPDAGRLGGTGTAAARAEARRALDAARAQLASVAADVRADLARGRGQLPALRRLLADPVWHADPVLPPREMPGEAAAGPLTSRG